MSKVEVKEKYVNKPSAKKQKVINDIVNLCKNGLQNIKLYESTIYNDLSYCITGLDFILQNYNIIYENSPYNCQTELDKINLEYLQKQSTLMNTWFKHETNLKLADITQQDILYDIGNKLEYTSYANGVVNIYEKYYNTLNLLNDCINTDKDINYCLDNYLLTFTNSKTDAVEIPFFNQEDADVFVEFINKRDYIIESVDNFNLASEEIKNNSNLNCMMYQESENDNQIKIKINLDNSEYTKE